MAQMNFVVEKFGILLHEPFFVETIDNNGDVVYVDWDNIPEPEQQRLSETLSQLTVICKAISKYSDPEEVYDEAC